MPPNPDLSGSASELPITANQTLFPYRLSATHGAPIVWSAYPSPETPYPGQPLSVMEISWLAVSVKVWALCILYIIFHYFLEMSILVLTFH